MTAPRHDSGARKALERLRPILARIEQGAQFCQDRGHGWTVEMEDREGRPLIAQLVADNPRLAELMPDLAARLTNRHPLGELSWTGILQIADQALAALTAKDSFNRKPGERPRYGKN